MDLNNIKYTQLKNFLENQYETHKDFSVVKDVINGFHGSNIEEKFSSLASIMGLKNGDLNKEIWDNLIDILKSRDEAISVTKLGKRIKNDAVVPLDEYSTWQLYKKKLINQNWSERSIKNIEKTSIETLQNLSMDTPPNDAVKGLVIGNVQSGKTANMAGLMAMAADNGFNYFIILSGVIESLRQQTSTRLYNDMHSSGQENLHWHQINNPSGRSKAPEHNISRFNLGENDKDKYFTVSLKNKSRLKALKKWLFSDPNKAKQLKILVIDDEADQASVNTNKIEEEDSTAINQIIREIINTDKVKGMNYISYTATPYANILNETSRDSLYPKDFILLLEPAEDYIGPKQIFGTEEPETSPHIDIIRDISERDTEIIKEIQDGNLNQQLPPSMVQSIHWFILTVAAMRANDYRKPISMLVHTSFKISNHKYIAEKIAQYLKYFKFNYEEIVPQLKDLYENESLDFKRSHFIEGMRAYSTPEKIPEYPEWESIRPYIERMVRLPENDYVSHIPIGAEGEPVYHKGIHLVIDNSQAKADNQIVRLVYPKKEQLPSTAPAFIVVGGNTLSRGLTLEGLTATYFLRMTDQADTLMQMGRWFGFRKGYEIFPRVWLDRMAYERFEFLSQMNEELREEITNYARYGSSPNEYGPRIKNSANYNIIKITSNNKMQSAKPVKYDFLGFNTQTIYFANKLDELQSNLLKTKTFLNHLEKPEIKDKYMIWRNIPTEKIVQFLKEYQVCSVDTKMSSLPALIEWTEKNAEQLSQWSVILSSVGKVEDTKELDSEWDIHGYSPKAVTRTKLKRNSTEDLASIGALRSPSDLLADIEAELSTKERNEAKISNKQAIRDKYGYGEVPQLIIYKIDKGNMSEDEFRKISVNKKGEPIKVSRVPLNFPLDLIGINIMMPGYSKGRNLATHISAKIDIRDQINEEEHHEEENE